MFSNKNKTKPCTVFAHHVQSMVFPVHQLAFPGLKRKARPSQVLIKLSNLQTTL